MADFDDADFYGGDADEYLIYEEPEEYIANAYEDWDENDGPVEVCAYQREVASQEWMRRAAEDAVDQVAEYWWDTYDNPEGSLEDFADARVALERAFQADMTRVIREHLTVWRCKIVARRTYSVDEVRSILVSSSSCWSSGVTDA